MEYYCILEAVGSAGSESFGNVSSSIGSVDIDGGGSGKTIIHAGMRALVMPDS